MDFENEIHEQQDIEFNKYNESTLWFNIHNTIFCFLSYIYNMFVFFIKSYGIYLIWIFLHYTSSHLYVYLCVPKTIIGFIMSPFMTSSPHCQGIRWIVYNTANMINNMWLIFGTWICSNIFSINNVNNVNNVNKIN
jgi:hypothetical protein